MHGYGIEKNQDVFERNLLLTIFVLPFKVGVLLNKIRFCHLSMLRIRAVTAFILSASFRVVE